MDEEKKENSTADVNGQSVPGGGSASVSENNDDFNRTVIIEKPSLKKGREQTPLRKIVTPFTRKRQEVEDLIGGVDVSNYTGEVPFFFQAEDGIRDNNR